MRNFILIIFLISFIGFLASIVLAVNDMIRHDPCDLKMVFLWYVVVVSSWISLKFLNLNAPPPKE